VAVNTRTSEHVRLDDTVMEPLMPEGRVPVFILRINVPDRIVERDLQSQLGTCPGQIPGV
jgi:hypothetical protein